VHAAALLQVFAAVLAIMAIFSYPPIFNLFSLNPTFVNPLLIVIYACLILLSRNMALKPTIFLVLVMLPATLAGAGLALAVEYITYAANGNSYNDTVTKVRSLGARCLH
jgi:hypothetical protein